MFLRTARNILFMALVMLLSCKPRQHTAPKMPDIGSIGNEVGTAIVIPDMLQGLATSSGSKYDTSKFTGAHKRLKFGSKVVVTNTLTGASITVKIIDRGPIGAGQVIALSKAAAKKLDTTKATSFPVRIRYKE
jgi:rare lipoprotein A